MKKLLNILLFLSFSVLANAQLNCTFTHYSQENGLSENSVMDMVQDHDGMIWFATWDGINRFDGYDFKVYKARKENEMRWSSNRVDHLQVDRHGDVWCITYDGRVFRFDKRMETFTEVPAEGTGKDLAVTSILPLDNGTVWLLTDKNGGIRVVPDSKTGKLTSKVYLSTAAKEKGTAINTVFLDAKNKEWLLTQDGLFAIDGSTGKKSSFFVNTHLESGRAGQSFFSAVSVNEHVYFTSGYGRIWKYSLKDESFELKELSLEDDIVAIRRLAGNKIIMATRKSGFVVSDESLDNLTYYNPADKFDFSRFPVRSLYVDSHSEVWFEVQKVGCVCHFNPSTGVFKVEQASVEQEPGDAPKFAVCEDKQGDLWVHPLGGGLSWFDRKQNCLLPFYNETGADSWRFSNKLHAMMLDHQGNLWLGTHSKGLDKVTFFKNEFNLLKPLDCNYDTNANQVRALCVDSRKQLWIGTRDGKISVYSLDFKRRGYLTTDGRIASAGTLFKGSAYKIIEDSKGNIWIATKGNGLLQLIPQGDAYRLLHYTYDAGDIYSLSHNSVYDLCEDGYGRIWVVTFGGGINYIERRDDGSVRFVNSRNNLKSYPIERCYKARRIRHDRNGMLWVATSNGLLSFSEKFAHPGSINFHLHVYIPGQRETLTCNDIYDILLTHDNRLFFATFGGGLNELKSVDKQGNALFLAYGTKDGLPTDVLFSLAEDKSGNVWMGSESGLSKMNVANHHFDNYLKQEIGEELLFEESTAIASGDGRLMFGTNRGLLCFNPAQIRKNAYVPEIIFSGLKIANKIVLPQAGSVLPESLNSLSHLRLSHKENTVTLAFAALDMSFPENVQYAYILEGFDKEWNYVGKQRTATYTNLPKGNYVFRVKSTNGAGIWVENEHSLKITVKPSFWETPYAYVLYVVAFMLVLLGGAYILFLIYRLKHEVSVEQQVTDMKLRFFTNISHELRTPLTLIEGPLEYILRRADLNKEVREQLQVVERNTHRMLRLVNQILDFRKIQNHKMKLCVEQVDIVAFVRKIMENFESVAESNKIDFIFESEQDELKLWVDADKVEKIVFNLLSNAFKYTQPGKTITVFIHDNEGSVTVGVQDQGIGIPESRKNSLFVRFETLLDKNLFNPNSSGIGLSLVKELVEMHHATIRVESKEGEGSCFMVDFLKGKEHYGEEVEFVLSDNVQMMDAISKQEVPDEVVAAAAGDSVAGEKEKSETVPEATMLLVEDNLELRFFLRSIFGSRFRIIEAVNGVEGLEKVVKFVPDIIISDIMMPEKDGITLVRELREELTTSHIPIVLLTAKTDMDTKLQSLKLGADSYITKPFSATYLEARVDNLLARRQRLRQFYCDRLMNINPSEVENEEEEVDMMSDQDRRFLDRLTDFMERNIDNGELVVDDLVHEMAVSRSVFFKKLKSLTGLAPIEFIKEMRVKRAAQLIETGEFNMTQISYMVGINDPRYFSKCFKQRFGMTPTEYKDKQKNK